MRRGGAILLEEDGFRVIEARGLRRSPLSSYRELTHVCLASRALLIGTTSGLIVVRYADFVDPETGPRAARDALTSAIARQPEATAQWQAIERVEALSASPARLWATSATALLCLVGTVFQLRSELLEPLGAFVPELFARGELWRAVTAHFLHGLPAGASPLEAWLPGLSRFPVHLALNVAGLFVLGPLVERPLGGWRTTLVLLAGGLGSIAGIVAAGHHEVIGASGLVAALAGAILALELHHAAELPAEWRIPRRIFLMAVILQFGVLDPLMRAFIAGGAHLGGFAGGYAAGFWLGVPSVAARRSNARPRRLALAGLFLAGAAVLGIVPLGRQDEPALERHAARLLNVPPAPHLFLHENAAAWLLATHAHPTAEGLELAIALAERAVASTARLSPDLLDTLAEALFQAGDRLGAILTIDEAIALAPRERYFREQRRRFTGERDPDDRPPPPGSERGDEGDRGEDGEGDGEGDESPFDPDMPRITT